jgi:hypothetical protein
LFGVAIAATIDFVDARLQDTNLLLHGSYLDRERMCLIHNVLCGDQKPITIGEGKGDVALQCRVRSPQAIQTPQHVSMRLIKMFTKLTQVSTEPIERCNNAGGGIVAHRIGSWLRSLGMRNDGTLVSRQTPVARKG